MNTPAAPAATLAQQQAVQGLRRLLVEGQINPGQKLNERLLAEALAVSRTPLREAIRQLAAEGLVELLPHRGAVALRLDAAAAAHTFELMQALEGLSGELAAQRISAQALRELQAQHLEMLAAWTRRDLPAYYRLNASIHQGINTAAANPVLSATYAQVNARLQALRFRSNQDEARWAQAVQEHESMMDALARRDGTTLGRLLRLHLQHKAEAVLAQWPPPPPSRRASATPAHP